MQKMLKIADDIVKTKQNHVKRIWPLERAPSISTYLKNLKI